MSKQSRFNRLIDVELTREMMASMRARSAHEEQTRQDSDEALSIERRYQRLGAEAVRSETVTGQGPISED